MSKPKIEIASIIAIFLVAGVAGVLLDSVSIHNTGVTSYVPELTISPSIINWGVLNPNESKVQTVEFTTTKPINYSLSYENFEPQDLFEFVTVTCNASGTVTNSETLSFLLSVSETAPETPFSFDIVIRSA